MSRLLFIVVLFTLAQCKGPEARRPVEVKSGSFLKESAERNKELLAREEKVIGDLISADSLNQYFSTNFLLAVYGIIVKAYNIVA